MPTLRLRFPAGRYHATPWGHHVNEGLVEWPPSPWRIIRALVACGYATQQWTELPPTARSLVEALATTLPRYRLPPATLAHSRHYMPLGTFDKGREKTTLVFDAWADVGNGELEVRWDVELGLEEQRLLRTLAAALGYFGRSESWVEATVIDQSADDATADDAFPHSDAYRPTGEWEQVSIMAPEPPSSYATWREHAITEAVAKLALPAGKRTKAHEKKIAAVVAPYPVDVVDAIQRDTAWWKAHRWSQPPGSRRVVYWRRADGLRVTTPTRARPATAPSVEMMLLAITTPSGSTSALPSTARTLPQAELLHRALVSRAGNGHRIDCPELTGRDDRARPLAGHRHAHVLPLDLDGDGRLEHIVVYAPMQLSHQAQHAIRNLRRTWTKGGVGELQLAIAGHGRLEDLRKLPAPFANAIHGLLGDPSGSRTWVSDTVFVPPRHLKRRGRNTLAGQVNDELTARGLPAARFEVLPWNEQNYALRHAVRVRTRRPPPIDLGLVLRLSFDSPVRGPIMLGYGAHFGLGRFRAVADAV